ncbi:MAG TPA: zf-HC2 domain-containing protein [Gemmatimonadaceae bacterium]
MTINEMNCDRFDEALSEYLEESLNEADRAAMERHLKECVRCAGLVRDLDRIRTEAAALPDLVPSRDLWAGIEARIAAPVIPFAATREQKRSGLAPWMAAAAAALIVSTAGITYVLTASSIRNSDVSRVAAVPTAQRSAEAPTTAQPTASEEPATSTTGSEGVSSGLAKSSAPPAVSLLTRATPRAPDVGARMASQSTDDVYGKEIDMLQRIVTDRRTQLDSATIAVIERNLRIIDAAIAQSKAALLKDPASLLLSDQLTRALDKKVELLRTAAMLPAST